jgi:hypothetical protein
VRFYPIQGFQGTHILSRLEQALQQAQQATSQLSFSLSFM